MKSPGFRTPTARTAAATASALALLAASPVLAKDLSKVKGEFRNEGIDDDAKGSLNLSIGSKGGKLDVKLKGMDPSTTFELVVDGMPEAEFETDARGKANLRFQTGGGKGRVRPMDFDPRGKTMSVTDGTDDVLAVVASGTASPLGMTVDERAQLTATAGTAGTARARFRSRKDGRQDFDVELEGVAPGAYTLFVDGIERGTIDASSGLGEIEFDSPPTDDPNVLDFDPRGKTVDVYAAAGLAFSGPMLASADGVTQCAFAETRVAIASTGLDSDGSADAKYRVRENCKKSFDVEVEDVPVGTYEVWIDGVLKGSLVVVDDGVKVEGELEFSSGSDDEDELPLDFDPEGALVEVKQAGSVFFSGAFVGGTTSGSSSDTCTPSEEEVPLISTGAAPGGSGDAEFRVRDDCENKFDVEIEDVPLGAYDVYVDGLLKGTLTVVFDGEKNEGELEFSSDSDDADELPLDFDPHGKLIEVKQGATVFFSRTFEGGSTEEPETCVAAEIRGDLAAVGPGAGAKGEARYRVDADCDADFSVEAEDLPDGSYDVVVAGTLRGTLVIADGEGQVEYDSDPTEAGKILLVFDPRGQSIEILGGGAVYMSLAFPAA